MSRILTLVFILVSVVSTHVKAQTKTQRTILEKSASAAALEEQKTFLKLKTLAAQKGWPMLTRGKNGRVARLIGVDLKGAPLYVTTFDNLLGATTVRTNALWPGGSTGLNLSGSSANIKGKLAIWDGGRILGGHVEFGGRILQKDNPAALEDHSTHVAGIMVNSGVNPNAKGMAFGAQQLTAYDFTNHISEMFAEAPSLLISNHSYGTISGWYFNEGEDRWEFRGEAGANEDYKFGYYDNDARNWDSMAYNAPYYLIVKAAGNNRDETGPEIGDKYFRYNAANSMIDAGNRPAGISSNNGYDILPTYSVAKNVLTVGAVNAIPGGYLQPSDVVLTSFTSWGPTDDGRIKPDIVTDGVNLLSAITSGNTDYAYLSGTSMATPVASGSLYLLQEYYSRLHNGQFMRSATLKGLVIHTADEAGPSDGPDYKHGWGLLNMERAASVITSNNSDQLIREETLNNGATFTLPVVASGKGTLMATISWTDPKGTVNTNNRLNNPEKKLIHDLDIKITSGSETYMPYILNPADRDAPATTGDNVLDNVEKIVIPDAVPGKTYTITVKHKGNLERGSQAFSLLVSGVGGQAYCVSAPTTAGSTRIESIQIGGTLKEGPTSCAGQSNLTNETFLFQAATAYPVSIVLRSCDGTNPSRIVKIFLDANNNGTFDAGEMLAQSAVLTGNTNYTGQITTPATLVTGNFSLLRIVVVETNNAASVTACGGYAKGETLDMRALVSAPSANVGVIGIDNPNGLSCALDSQMVSIRIKNFGDEPQSNIPLTATIKRGATTIATWNTRYPGTILPFGEATFTFQSYFNAAAGNTYTITAATALAGDQSTGNDAFTGNIVLSNGADAPTGTAEQCGTNQVVLTRTGSSNSGKAYWYTTATGGTPIASGNVTTTSVIPPNRTYYLGLNDVRLKVGLPNKTVYPNGGYNEFAGYVRITATGPMVIESARLYIGNPGKLTVILGEIANETNGEVSTYYPIDSTVLDVFATTPNPAPGSVQQNNPLDTGAVYLLNLAIPQAGSKYILILQCADGATIFRNTSTTTMPYPFSIPETFSITGNYASPQQDHRNFYYWFYDMRINLLNCASPRTAIVAGNITAPVITLSGSTLTSSAADGNQWFRDGAEISGATGQTYTPVISGTYKSVVTASSGCLLASNEIPFISTAVIDVSDNEIRLSVSPNPNDGRFQLQFEFNRKADLEISLINFTGQRVYSSNIPGFVGRYSKQINQTGLSKGVYMLRITHGKDMYVKKIIIN